MESQYHENLQKKVFDKLGEIYQKLLKIKRDYPSGKITIEQAGEVLFEIDEELRFLTGESHSAGLNDFAIDKKFYVPKINFLKKKTYRETRDIVGDLVIELRYSDFFK